MENYTVLEILKEQLQEIIDKSLVLGVALEGKTAEDNELKNLISSIKYPEIDLKNFTQKMDAWIARYNHTDNIPIKATMAFTARMFYQHPNVARQWYDNLPKTTLD